MPAIAGEEGSPLKLITPASPPSRPWGSTKFFWNPLMGLPAGSGVDGDDLMTLA